MPAVAAPADRRFRRAHVKPAKRRRVGVRHVWLVAKVTAVLGVAIYGGWRGTALLLGAPALQVSRILVRGNERLSVGEVLAIVDGMRGRNILTIDLGIWRSRLLASPWVEDAALRRTLPGRIEIEIRERRPKIRAAVASGDYRTAFTTAAGFRPSVDRFFSDVLVMAEDEAVRAARLGLVAELRDLILSLADISEIAGAAAPQD